MIAFICSYARRHANSPQRQIKLWNFIDRLPGRFEPDILWRAQMVALNIDPDKTNPNTFLGYLHEQMRRNRLSEQTDSQSVRIRRIEFECNMARNLS